MRQLMRLIQEYSIHAIPLEVAGQGLDPFFHAMQIVIVPEPRFYADTLLPRLLVIYFPRVEIKDGGAALQSVQPL